MCLLVYVVVGILLGKKRYHYFDPYHRYVTIFILFSFSIFAILLYFCFFHRLQHRIIEASGVRTTVQHDQYLSVPQQYSGAFQSDMVNSCYVER